MADTRAERLEATDEGRPARGHPAHPRLAHPRSAHARPARPRRSWRNVGLTAVAALFLWALATVDVDPADLLVGPGRLIRILSLMFGPPDWAYAGRAWEGMVESIQMAWIGTLLGAAISLPLGFFAAGNITSRTGSTAVRQVLNAIRSVPELILAIAFIPVVGLGPFGGTLALGLHSVGTLGKWTSEIVEGIDPGPVEAARATGGRQVSVMRWGVLPQVLPEVVAFWLYRFEINLRAAAVLGIVGAGGIGEIITNTLLYRRWDKAGMALIVIVAATIAIDMVSSRIRRRIIAGPGAGGGRRKEEPESFRDGFPAPASTSQ